MDLRESWDIRGQSLHFTTRTSAHVWHDARIAIAAFCAPPDKVWILTGSGRVNSTMAAGNRRNLSHTCFTRWNHSHDIWSISAIGMHAQPPLLRQPGCDRPLCRNGPLVTTPSYCYCHCTGDDIYSLHDHRDICMCIPVSTVPNLAALHLLCWPSVVRDDRSQISVVCVCVCLWFFGFIQRYLHYSSFIGEATGRNYSVSEMTQSVPAGA